MRAVLLIDDDRVQYRLTQAHFDNFQAERYRLDWAATFEDGLEKLLSGSYIACLLDYQLGERDGLQLIREAMERDCRTPIVFLTSETADRVDIEALQAGAFDYLVKSEISPRILERSLRYALKLAETLAALRQLATRDQLTGLLNRREFDRILADERERALRFGHPLALVMVDVDRFKRINDDHGHQAGDAVLCEISRRLTAQVRTVDRVARLGGEEFALILMQTDGEGAAVVARRVCDAVSGEAVVAGAGVALDITVSSGSAALPADARTDWELVAAADKALYEAKARGRNRAAQFFAGL